MRGRLVAGEQRSHAGTLRMVTLRSIRRLLKVWASTPNRSLMRASDMPFG